MIYYCLTGINSRVHLVYAHLIVYMYIKSANLCVISNKIIITNYYYYYYSIWSEAQSHLPKNIYNFTIRYINNSLPTRKNMARWGLSQSPDCSFCLNPESLLHVVAGCQQYLDRFTWRHDSILNFIAKSLQPVINVHSSLYADVNGFLNPSIITGENYRPDLLFLIQSKCLYVLELTLSWFRV